jgi:hypothetical protein
MKKKKTTKKAAGFTFWRKNVKNSILGAFSWAKNTVCETVRKTWEMLLDDNYGVAWGGIVFGAFKELSELLVKHAFLVFRAAHCEVTVDPSVTSCDLMA